MLHITLEYSANILDPVQPELLHTMHLLLAEAGPFIAYLAVGAPASLCRACQVHGGKRRSSWSCV